MDTIIKTVKQYSNELDDDAVKELLFIANQYKNVKNYVYSRYSGINSIPLLGKDRQIRDEWTETKFYEGRKLPARYWKLALSEAFGNIKSQWSNTKRKIKAAIKQNINLSDEDRHYIYYVLKFDKCYWKVLTNQTFDIPKIFEDKDLNYKYLNNLIKRYTRRYKGNIPYSNRETTFSIDMGLYLYKDGYIKERLEYKCDYNSIKYTYINPAYTSKMCNICGQFGIRNGDVFTCPKCGKVHADSNASKNILNRKYDKEISLYTPYSKVKEILEGRVRVS